MNKEELEKNLADLRLKWKTYPKSSLEPNWWKFKCDSLKATQIKEQIKKIENGVEILAADLITEQVKNIFK
jgi:hypothetical protein